MEKMMAQAAITAVPPTLTNFLKLNSSPKAKSKKMTPISDHVWILAVSMTEGVSVKCGLAKNPATMYPNTKGCFRRLKTSVMTPAQIKISAKSLIRGANSDIGFFVLK
jgi:hypothetical protein